ncbi:hypothetical protein BELL_0319g00160 [Botrytis elliptica]|uniref:Uncharacterized protein n=1 Tax=Botrytis elliptica TaxID=278938 RepID=A0A4Z1JXT7_9HELO|nr:hypothetical protein BELL_0319g00160 [Botrytis elliptica]
MCLATMLIALKANLEPTVLVNLGMGLLVLILAFVGACCRQVYTKHVAKEPLLLTVEPKSAKFIKTELETEKRFNESQMSPGYLAIQRTKNHHILGLNVR